jgi:putative dimethyl sulfoxide reductase chaperone
MDNSNQHNILKGYNMLLYFAGSMIMYEPSEECVVDFWKNGILKNLPVSSTNPNFMKAASQLRESCSDQDLCGKMLRDDYTRLFSRLEQPLAHAYESFYRGNGRAASDFKMNNVTEFYDSYGWESRLRKKIKDDHLGMELLFLTILVEKYLDFDDEACKSEMRNEIRRFIDHHIFTWIHKWNNKIQSESNTLCYKGIGTLILACSEDIFSLLNGDSTTSQPGGNLKN